MRTRSTRPARPHRRHPPVPLVLLVLLGTCRPPDLTASGGCIPWTEGSTSRRASVSDVGPPDVVAGAEDVPAGPPDAGPPRVAELPPLRVHLALRPGAAGAQADAVPRDDVFFSQLAAALAARPLFEPDPDLERVAEAAVRAAARRRSDDGETSGSSTGLEPFLVVTVGLLRPAAGAAVTEPTYVVGLTLAARRTLERRALDAPPAVQWQLDLPARAVRSARLVGTVAQAIEARAQVELDREVGAARELLDDPLLAERSVAAESQFFVLGRLFYPDLVEALDAERPEQRATAGRALARAADPDLLDAYRWMLTAEDPELRLAGLDGLWRLAAGRTPVLGETDEGIPAPDRAWIVAPGETACRFGSTAEADPSSVTTRRAALEDQAEELRRCLTDAEPHVARAGLVLLAEAGDAETARHVRAALRRLDDPDGENLLWLALGRLGDRGALPRLRSLAGGDDPLATVAALSVARLGDRSADPRLRTLLVDDDPRVRCAAAEALAGARDPAVASELVPLLAADQPTPVVRAAQAALLRMGETAVPALAAALDGAEPSVAWAAAETLGDIGSPAAVAPLTARLAGLDAVLRDYIVEALGRIGELRALPALVAAFGGTPAYRNEAPILRAIVSFGRQAVPALVDGLGSTDRAVRAGALEALVRLGDTDHTDEVRALLDDDDADVRRRAARYFATARSPQAVDSLAARLEDPDETVAAAAAETLGAYDDARARSALADAVADSRGTVAAAAARSLATLGDVASVRAILEAGARLSAYDRGRVVEALAAFGRPALAPSVEALASDRLRPVALEVLDGLDLPVTAETLGRYRKDGRPAVRELVTRLLGRSEDPAAIEPLRELLGDESPAVREAAVGAVTQLGGPEAAGLLRRALDDEQDEWVARAIRRALLHLGSVP
ncbi:MAG: HEAT repeat domain-containing protein [Deltaproteobacteria bacterium]|nr:HEAT repeat domain-containing protein [Deltaproteobacteria bacterium]